MLPILTHIAGLKFYTFGAFLVLAFFWSTFLLWKNIRLTSYREEDIFDGLFWSLVGGLFISRLIYVVLNFSKFGLNILKFILINGYPGMSLYGFLLGFCLSLLFFCMSRKIVIRQIVDYFVAPASVALGFGKIGSFFAGSEIGIVTKFPLHVLYQGVTGHRHITALYEAAIFFVLAYLVSRILFAVRRGRFFDGFGFYFFVWTFALITLLSDFIKAQHLLIFGFSFNMLVSAFLLLTFSLYFLYYFRNLIGDRFARIGSLLFRHGRKNKTGVHKKAAESST